MAPLQQPAFCRIATFVVASSTRQVPQLKSGGGWSSLPAPGVLLLGRTQAQWHCGCGEFPLQVSPAHTCVSPALSCSWLLRPGDEIVEPENGLS